MGIYIKDMEMPISCQECAFRVDESEINVHEWICLINQYPTFYCKKSQSHAEDEKYLQDCPLVPIPPHGDLIERKAIGLTDFEIVMCDGNYKDGMKMLLEKIESAPTIISAEEGE